MVAVIHRLFIATSKLRSLGKGYSVTKSTPEAPSDISVASLRDAWRSRSQASCWWRPDDWWCPAVDALVETVVAELDPLPAAERLGRARADAGVGIVETVDDIAALYSVLTAQEPPLMILRSLMAGWVDTSLAPVRSGSCEDALTGLATPAYLRTRLTEIYRAGRLDGSGPGSSHALVIIDAGGVTADLWSRVTRMCVLADGLRSVFPGGETMTLTGPGTVVVLCERTTDFSGRLAKLHALMGELPPSQETGPDRQDEPPPRMWVEALPPQLQQGLALLDELSH
jgi:hypothetical protein